MHCLECYDHVHLSNAFEVMNWPLELNDWFTSWYCRWMHEDFGRRMWNKLMASKLKSRVTIYFKANVT